MDGFMLSKKEILEILDRLKESNSDEFIELSFVYIESEMRLAMINELTKSTKWEEEDYSFIKQFIKRCREMVDSENYKGLSNYHTDYLNSSFLNETFYGLFSSLPIDEWSRYFETNKEDAYFVLMSIKSFPFEQFDEVFKNIVLTCPNNTLRIDFYQENPLYLQSFSNGYGYQALKKVKETDLLHLFVDRKKSKYYTSINFVSKKEATCFNSIFKWCNQILMTQPSGDRINIKTEDSMSIDFTPIRKKNEISLNNPFSVEGDAVVGYYTFVLSKKIEDYKINDLDQFRRLKHLVQVLSLNSKIEYYFAINPSSGNSAYESYVNHVKNNTFDNNKKSSDEKKKIIYKKLRELEKEESSIVYKLKTLSGSKLNRYKEWSYPNYKEIAKKKVDFLKTSEVLKYKFNYTAFILNNKCKVSVLKNIEEFIDQNPEYYDKEKQALSEEGVDLFFLNYLF